jgi:SHS2 domain-containing protein
MPSENKGYEFFEHTADVGIRASGQTLHELFIRMAQGLVELLAEDSKLKARQEKSIRLSADDAPSILLAWLQELLFWFSTERFLPVDYTLNDGTPTSLRGTVRGDTFDPSRHVQGREVKAITRHLLSVEQRAGVWHGQVIVDI